MKRHRRIPALVLLLAVAALAQQVSMPVAIGTKIDIRLNTPLSTRFSQPGDQFTADVFDGAYRGGIIHGTVRSVATPGHSKGSAEVLLSFDRLVMPDGRRCRILAEVSKFFPPGDKVGTEGHSESPGPGKYTAVRAGLGSAVGAASGKIFHAGEGAAIGALAGAAAGTDSKADGARQQVLLPSGTQMEITVFDN